MTTENTITAITLPEPDKFKHDLDAINNFQQTVHQNLIQGQDYGIIPGTEKPTLLKPGAEKIAKLLGLADIYELVDRQENWQTPFFRYLVKCKLVSVSHQVTISEGIGECNSMESKYRWRWLADKKLPPGIDKTKLYSETRNNKKTGGHWTVYRLENDDIYSQVNTILKMAKKRALVDAALSAGRLSNLFTQDIEDLHDNGVIESEATVVEEPHKAAPTPASTPAEKTAKEQHQEISTPANPGDLITWAYKHGKTYNMSWVCKQLNVEQPEQIKDIPNAIAILRELTGWTD